MPTDLDAPVAARKREAEVQTQNPRHRSGASDVTKTKRLLRLPYALSQRTESIRRFTL